MGVLRHVAQCCPLLCSQGMFSVVLQRTTVLGLQSGVAWNHQKRLCAHRNISLELYAQIIIIRIDQALCRLKLTEKIKMRDMDGNIVEITKVATVAATTPQAQREYALEQAAECERLARVHAARGRPASAARESASAARYRRNAGEF